MLSRPTRSSVSAGSPVWGLTVIPLHLCVLHLLEELNCTMKEVPLPKLPLLDATANGVTGSGVTRTGAVAGAVVSSSSE